MPQHLSGSELAKAARLNDVWRNKTQWPEARKLLDAGISDLTDPVRLAEAVADFQATHGLQPDGILGPKTAAALIGFTWTEPTGRDRMLLGAKSPQVEGVKVLDWTETGLSFGPGRGLLYRRAEPITMGVLHTTGGEGSGHQVWNTLVHRNLSVDFLLDSDGTLYQYNDPTQYATAHGGWTNPRSWGMEITNDIDPKRGTVVRPRIDGTLRGSPFTWDGLLEPQINTLVKVVSALCDRYGITKQIPGHDGKVIDGPPADPDLLRRYRVAKAAHRNVEARKIGAELIAEVAPKLTNCVVGHYMVSFSSKVDPSPDTFSALLHAGF